MNRIKRNCGLREPCLSTIWRTPMGGIVTKQALFEIRNQGCSIPSPSVLDQLRGRPPGQGEGPVGDAAEHPGQFFKATGKIMASLPKKWQASF